jgi:hypothetical protein
MPDQDYLDTAFRHGLKAIKTPEGSADFNIAVLQGVGQPGTWLEHLMVHLRPALSAMCISLAVSLAVLYYSINGPISIPMPRLPDLPTSKVNLSLIDNVLDEPNLKADSLFQLPGISSSVSFVPPTPPHRRPDLRHACLPVKTLDC